jgi:hypothetical protein
LVTGWAVAVKGVMNYIIGPAFSDGGAPLLHISYGLNRTGIISIRAISARSVIINTGYIALVKIDIAVIIALRRARG